MFGWKWHIHVQTVSFIDVSGEKSQFLYTNKSVFEITNITYERQFWFPLSRI